MNSASTRVYRSGPARRAVDRAYAVLTRLRPGASYRHLLPVTGRSAGLQAPGAALTIPRTATTSDPILGSEVAATVPRHHPAVARELARAEDVQVRIADLITRFAGSMPFVYVHMALFAAWMLHYERSPWPSLTLVVSLEAIFLSTFVMIGQNSRRDFNAPRPTMTSSWRSRSSGSTPTFQRPSGPLCAGWAGRATRTR